MPGIITDETSRAMESPIAAIHEALAERIGEQKHRVWFRNSTNLALGDGYLKVGVPNLFIANWLESHFREDIVAATETVVGHRPKVTFVVDAALSARQRATPLKAQAGAPTKQRSSAVLSSTPPLRNDKRLRMTLDTFVVGSSNELAFNAARAVVREEHSPFNPLFIHGGYGVGKTHLLQGICNEVAAQRPGTRWMYLSAEEFANQFVLALKTKKLEAFRRRMRQTDLLAIDDIHFLANKPSMQEEFLHTFNTIDLAGKQVVLVSDAHPKMIGQVSEKLVSRFVSGMVVKIEPPDFQTRCEICRKCAERMMDGRLGRKRSGSEGTGRQMPENVVRYIAERLRNNVRELEGALLKLIAFAALQNERITLAMAQAVLAEHLERCDPIVHVSDIETAAANYFGTTPTSIHSGKKHRAVSLARHFSMYLTRKYTNMSSAEIGRFMGNKNHATVLMACKKIEDLLARNADVRWQGPKGNRVVKARTILANLENSISG